MPENGRRAHELRRNRAARVTEYDRTVALAVAARCLDPGADPLGEGLRGIERGCTVGGAGRVGAEVLQIVLTLRSARSRASHRRHGVGLEVHILLGDMRR